MTKNQIIQFNRMLYALKQISKEYQTPEQLRKNVEKDYGLSYQEALEMSYENIQETAKRFCKGVKEIKS